MGAIQTWTSDYPVSIDTYPALIDGTHDVIANHPNVLSEAIVALETKIGQDNSVDPDTHDYILRRGRLTSDQGSGTTAFDLSARNVYSSGDLLVVKHSGDTTPVDRFSVDFDGSVVLGGSDQASTLNHDIAVDKGGTNPAIRYNGTTGVWQFSNTGTGFTNMVVDPTTGDGYSLQDAYVVNNVINPSTPSRPVIIDATVASDMLDIRDSGFSVMLVEKAQHVRISKSDEGVALTVRNTVLGSQFLFHPEIATAFGFAADSAMLQMIGGSDVTGRDVFIDYRNEQTDADWLVGLDSTDDSFQVWFESKATSKMKLTSTAALFEEALQTNATTLTLDLDNTNQVITASSGRVTLSGDLAVNSTTLWLGGNNDVNKRIIADQGDANEPEIRYNATSNAWEFRNTGTVFAPFSAADLNTAYVGNNTINPTAAIGPVTIDNLTQAVNPFEAKDNGTTIFVIEDGGNVGIGIANPARRAHIKHDGVGLNDIVRIENATAGANERAAVRVVNSNTHGLIYAASVSNTEFSGQIANSFAIMTAGSTVGDIVIAARASGKKVKIYAGGEISAANRVGVWSGTGLSILKNLRINSPSDPASTIIIGVNGDTSGVAQTYVNLLDSANKTLYTMKADSSGNGIMTVGDVAGTTRVTLDSVGDLLYNVVGAKMVLGGSAASTKMHLIDGTAVDQHIRMQTLNQIWDITNADSTGSDKFIIQDTTSGTDPFTIEKAAPTDSIYVKTSGVGIRTNAPASTFHVNGASTLEGNVTIDADTVFLGDGTDTDKVIEMNRVGTSDRLEYDPVNDALTMKYNNAGFEEKLGIAVQSHEATTLDTTDQTSFVDFTTFTFTTVVGRNYLLLFSSEVSSTDINTSMEWRIFQDNTATKATGGFQPNVTSDFESIAGVVPITATGTTLEIDFQYQINNGADFAEMRRARLVLWEITN